MACKWAAVGLGLSLKPSQYGDDSPGIFLSLKHLPSMGLLNCLWVGYPWEEAVRKTFAGAPMVSSTSPSLCFLGRTANLYLGVWHKGPSAASETSFT